MSSLFTVAEIELARLGLAALTGDDLDVVVGGLGLGYTACTALEDPRVRSLLVVEAIEDVIDWHRRGLLPSRRALTADPRCRFVAGDFFAAVAGGTGFDPEAPGRRFHAILLDVDHSPATCCTPATPPSTRRPGCAAWPPCSTRTGVFALWSNDPPDDDVQAGARRGLRRRRRRTSSASTTRCRRESANTVYVARTGP